MRPEGRLKCGWRKNPDRLRKLYFDSNAGNGTELAAKGPTPLLSGGW